MKKLKVKLEFVTPVLGSSPADPEIYSAYIASNAPDAKTLKEELADAASQEEVEEKKMTVFFKDDKGNPYLYDYVIKGFFKNAAKAMKQTDGSTTGNLAAYKGKIDNNIFILERKLLFGSAGNIDILQRPLRAETAQGPRVALSSSEQIAAGATLEFTIICLNDTFVPMIKEWLNYGILNGLCQWHNGGYGRFGWQLLAEEDLTIGEVIGLMQDQYKYKSITPNDPEKKPAKKTTKKTEPAVEATEEATKKRRGRPKKSA